MGLTWDLGRLLGTHNNRGHTWLAEKVGVSTSTVWRWCSGQRALRGPTAMAVRTVLKEMAPMKVHEITGLYVEAPEEREE